MAAGDKNSYFEKRKINCIERADYIIDQLPTFCRDFFIVIENNTSALTRLNYAVDLRIFFDFITKVVINNIEYTITNATSGGSNHTYTLDKNLINSVKANDIVKVMQDKVSVKCSLSNISSGTNFKDMKLVKSKILKGGLEGYTEEKYELEGEGRYSTIRLELERFNSNSENEIIELQQAFDYMED